MMSLGAKLAEVMAKCRYMPQDKENSFQKYKYTSAASMFGRINEALSDQKLSIRTRLELLEMRDVQTARGATEKYAVVSATVVVRDAESEESAEFVGLGSGQDAGDKAIMKANTAALKYAYIGGLCIAMADDPEDASPESSQFIPTKQPTVTTKPTAKKPEVAQNGGDKCSECGAVIQPKVAYYSSKKYGRKLCYNCQRRAEDDEVPFT